MGKPNEEEKRKEEKVLAKLQKSIQELKTKKHDGGFTLIELLIVVLIIGILAAIVIVAVGGQQKTATAKACSADAAALVAAMDRYIIDNGDTVESASGAGSLVANNPAENKPTLTGYTAYTATQLTGFTNTGGKKFIPDYLKSLPSEYYTDDATGDVVLLMTNGTNVAALCQIDGGTNAGI